MTTTEIRKETKAITLSMIVKKDGFIHDLMTKIRMNESYEELARFVMGAFSSINRDVFPYDSEKYEQIFPSACILATKGSDVKTPLTCEGGRMEMHFISITLSGAEIEKDEFYNLADRDFVGEMASVLEDADLDFKSIIFGDPTDGRASVVTVMDSEEKLLFIPGKEAMDVLEIIPEMAEEHPEVKKVIAARAKETVLEEHMRGVESMIESVLEKKKTESDDFIPPNRTLH